VLTLLSYPRARKNFFCANIIQDVLLGRPFFTNVVKAAVYGKEDAFFRKLATGLKSRRLQIHCALRLFMRTVTAEVGSHSQATLLFFKKLV
jgi:hypothetical protein